MPDWKATIHDAQEYKVFEALADASWDFRTISGISQSTGISELEVADILARHPELVRRSPVRDRHGRQLFTLRTRRPKTQEILAEIRSFVTKSSQ